MTRKNYEKAFKQLDQKPAKKRKYIKHNAPKKKEFGPATKTCTLCGRMGRGHIGKYGLELCRQCFRLNAKKIGFKKYS